MTKVVFSGFEKRGPRGIPQMQIACFNEVNEEYKFAEIYQQRCVRWQRIEDYVVNWQSRAAAGSSKIWITKQKKFTVREYGTARRALAAAKRYCVELGQRD